MRIGLIGGLGLVAGLVLAVCLGGCGTSGSSTSTETTAAISKAEFVAKGNAICAAGNKTQEAGINAYVKAHGLQNKKPTTAQTSEIVEHILAPNVQSQIHAVEALGAPSGEKEQVKAALETSQQNLEKVEANPELAFGNADPFAEAGKELHALGLNRCAPHS